KSSLRYHIQNNLIYVVRVQSEIVGYILVLIKRKVAKIYSLGVKKEHRGKKIAHLLISESLKQLYEMKFFKTVLEVRVDNNNAITLYENFGFKTIKKINSFYLDGCDAYLMEIYNGLQKLHKTI
ncbi:MAG: GNAT family N-acetyltransferase, partial [Sulfurimonas sp.]|nr:GNAT family N-acetyltransferase [Sulfurimonas sp.]